MRVTLRNVSVRRGTRLVLDRASFEVGPGEFLGVIGPNGAGKTTLLRAALGLLPLQGHASLAALPPASRARAAAWLPQTREAAWPISVEALVRLGRIAHRRPQAQEPAIEDALHRMGLTALRHRPVTALSGGEQARALIARALAQDTPALLVDEPIAGLDPAYQIATMTLLRDLARDGRTVIASLHDLGLVVRFCTRLLLMDRGRIVADGPPARVLTPDLLAQVFGIRGAFLDTADGPLFQPLALI